MTAMSGATAKTVGGSQLGDPPATKGAIMEPKRETVDDAPIAMFRVVVGNNSVVYIYLKIKPFLTLILKLKDRFDLLLISLWIA